jgi:hypothetical protein
MAVCNSHDLRPLTTFRLPNPGTPFFAGAKLPSMKASRHINAALSAQMLSQGFKDAPHDSRAYPLLKSSMAGLIRGIPFRQVRPRSAGTEHPKDAVQNSTSVFPRAPRRSLRRGGSGMRGARKLHWASVRSRDVGGIINMDAMSLAANSLPDSAAACRFTGSGSETHQH